MYLRNRIPSFGRNKEKLTGKSPYKRSNKIDLTAHYTMEELWQPIQGFEDRYAVSNLGRIKSFYHCNGKRTDDHIKKLPINIYGYRHVTLWKLGKSKTVSVHILVALHFIGPRTNDQINHKDGEKLNNHVSNLEYCSFSENSRHSVRMGLRRPRCGEAHRWAKLRKKDVLNIRKMCASNKITQKEIGDLFGVSSSHICGIKYRRIWKSA